MATRKLQQSIPQHKVKKYMIDPVTGQELFPNKPKKGIYSKLSQDEWKDYCKTDTNGRRKIVMEKKAKMARKFPACPPLKKQKLVEAGADPEIVDEVYEKRKEPNLAIAPIERKKQQPSRLAQRGLAGMAQDDQIRVMSLMKKHQVDPLEGLLLELKDPDLKPQERIAILKFLVPYTLSKKPELKALDVQQDMKMSVTVNVQSFRDMTKAEALDVSAENIVGDDEYDEFTKDLEEDPELISTEDNE